MLKPKFTWRWQSEEPQTIVILVFIFAFIFLSPVKGCNPQRDDKQWSDLKRRVDLERGLLKRVPSKAPQGNQGHDHDNHDDHGSH